MDHKFEVTKDGKNIVYFEEDEQHDADLWLRESTFSVPRRLTHLNPQFDNYKMGSPRLVSWLSDDGEPLHGALLLPPRIRRGNANHSACGVMGEQTVSILSITLVSEAKGLSIFRCSPHPATP